MKISHMRLGFKIGLKGCVEFISEEIFGKIFKNEDFGFKILEKCNILRPFSGITHTKMKMLSKKLRVRYVYIYIYVLYK